jgi:hypothetical protein
MVRSTRCGALRNCLALETSEPEATFERTESSHPERTAECAAQSLSNMWLPIPP